MDTTNYARNGKLISTMSLRLASDAQLDTENGNSYYITTKKYVDDQFGDVKNDTTVLKSSLSSTIERVTSLENFKTNFAVIPAVNNKPNVSGVATVGGIQVKKTPQEAAEVFSFQVDVSDYARLYSPRLEGQPMAPTPGVGVDTDQIATTAFVQKVKKAVTGNVNPTDLQTIKDISTSLGKQTDFKGYVDNALNLKLDKAKISVNDIPVHDENLSKESPVRHIATISIDGTTHNLRMDISDLAPLKSPVFTGHPMAPDKTEGTTSQIATYKDIRQQKEEILGVLENETLSGGFANVEEIAAQVNTNKNDITSLKNNKQPLDAALTSISNLVSKPSANKYRIIYSSNTNTYHNKDISETMLTLLQKNTQADIASFLSVPRIVSNTITTSSKISWDKLTAGEAVKAAYAISDGNNRNIVQTYATKEELGDISNGNSIVDKARKDSDGNVFSEHYLTINDGITKVNVIQGATSGTKVGTIVYQKGTTNENKTDLFVDLSNFAQLNTNNDQVFSQKFKIGSGSRISPVAVQDDIAAVTGDISQKQVKTLEDVINAINDDFVYSETVNKAINTKQDKNSTLTAISKITTDITANNILYTNARNSFGVTPISQEAITLISKNKAGMKSELGFVSASDTVAGAGYATYDYVEGTKTSGTKKKISDKYMQVTAMSGYVAKNITDIHDISGTSVTIERPASLNWVNAVSNTTKPVSLNTLAFWDGRFSSTNGVSAPGNIMKYSNLEYCKFGKFGDIVTHDFDEIPMGIKDVSVKNNILTITNSDNSTFTTNLPLAVTNITVDNGNNIKYTTSGSSTIKSLFVNFNCFGVCSTAAGTAAKTVTVSSIDDSSKEGTMVIVHFSNNNTATGDLTLKVNSDAPYPLVYRGARINSTAIKKDMIIPFVRTKFTDTDTQRKDCWAVIGSLIWTED